MKRMEPVGQGQGSDAAEVRGSRSMRARGHTEYKIGRAIQVRKNRCSCWASLQRGVLGRIGVDVFPLLSRGRSWTAKDG